MFVLEYRYDEAKRTTFGSHFGTMRSRQESHCHVATSPRRDVTKSRRGVNKCRSQPVTTSRRHHVATSPRLDVTTSRRQLENLHLIIKCQTAREFRAIGERAARDTKFQSLQHRLQGSSWIFVLVFLYCLIIFGSHDEVLHIIYFVSFLHDVLNLFLGLHQTLSQTMD